MIFIVVILSVFIIYGLTNFIIAKEAMTWILAMWPSLSPFVFYIIYSICALSVVIVFFLPASFTIRKYITLFSYYWMGIYFYLLLAILISMIILFFCFRFGLVSPDFQRQAVLITGWIVFFIVSASLIYGRVNAEDIKLNSYEVEIQKKSEISELKIALISDIHLNAINNYDHFNKVVDKINSINPDILCFSGDIFDGDYYAAESPEKIQKLLMSIQVKYGIYACIGNHDAGKTYNQMIEFLEKSSVNVLYDNYINIDNKFVIAGRRDSSPIGDQGEVRSQIPSLGVQYKDLPIIVLDHQPSNIRECNSDIDLVLCGHTHRGQIFPINYITKAIFDVDYGYYKKDQNSPHVIVSSGVGTWGPPFRIGTDNEVVSINIFFNK
ncbi:metallophosphoesterase [Clostridium sp. P21]|uniref:Metallophosphoesterase n=1 Tax=Clostridium muellerianum TaxID=2716538 RepID=A0A7Y0EF48_9CLOT|nr:metallophosphoesterase [Clostridium muellerianum]